MDPMRDEEMATLGLILGAMCLAALFVLMGLM